MGHPDNEQPHVGDGADMVLAGLSPRLAISRYYPCTALAKLAKNSSASFFAEPLISRWPSWASLPPICASTSQVNSVPPPFSASATLAPPLANPATPPSLSPEIL